MVLELCSNGKRPPMFSFFVNTVISVRLCPELYKFISSSFSVQPAGIPICWYSWWHATNIAAAYVARRLEIGLIMLAKRMNGNAINFDNIIIARTEHVEYNHTFRKWNSDTTSNLIAQEIQSKPRVPSSVFTPPRLVRGKIFLQSANKTLKLFVNIIM